MSIVYDVEYTDTFGGEANYSWVKRARVLVPNWSHFKGWDGNGRVQPKGFKPTLMRRAKAAVGITGMRGRTYDSGNMIEFRPYGSCTVLFITYREG